MNVAFSLFHDLMIVFSLSELRGTRCYYRYGLPSMELLSPIYLQTQISPVSRNFIVITNPLT